MNYIVELSASIPSEEFIDFFYWDFLPVSGIHAVFFFGVYDIYERISLIIVHCKIYVVDFAVLEHFSKHILADNE